MRNGCSAMYKRPMIDRASGEIHFNDSLSFAPQCLLSPEHLRTLGARSSSFRDLPGWAMHEFNDHESDRGRFEVEAVSDGSGRVQAVFLAHVHPFYQPDTPDDSERRAFHEGVISTDLGGQREFSWGQVLCRVDPKTNRDHLVVVYALGPNVPLHPTDILFEFQARADEPGNA